MRNVPPERAQNNLRFEEWMNTSAGFWEPLSRMWSGFSSEANDGPHVHGKWDKKEDRHLSGTEAETWGEQAESITENDVAKTLFMIGLFKPDEMSKMFQEGWNHLIKQQRPNTEVMEEDESRQLEELNPSTFARWLDEYEDSLQKFLNIPKIGLTRLYQEKMAQAFDKFNLFNVNMAEFLYLLCVPIKKAFKDMQEEVIDLSQKGTLPKDGNDYYKTWLNKLEAYYGTLFQSTQYTTVLGKTLSAMGEFLAKRDEIFRDALKVLPIPTQKEVESLHKEIYHLKKRLNKFEKNRGLEKNGNK